LLDDSAVCFRLVVSRLLLRFRDCLHGNNHFLESSSDEAMCEVVCL